MDNKTKLLIISPLFFILIIAITASYIPLKVSFWETDQQILDFTYTEIKIPEIRVTHIDNYLKSPFSFSSKIVDNRMEEKETLSSKIRKNEDVSLIVVSNRDKMAIIGGTLVKEGDKLADKKVARIEPDRILLKNKTSAHWVYIGDRR